MLIRALTVFVVFPGMVAFAIPIWVGYSAPIRYPLLAAPLLIAGTALLLWCVREFYVAGRGTLAPWSPPRHLVTSGPYGVCRNPMYRVPPQAPQRAASNIHARSAADF